MKQDTLNKLKTGNVVVYMDFVNYLGEVNESVEIARFRSQEWADNFVAGCRIDDTQDELITYRVEVIQ